MKKMQLIKSNTKKSIMKEDRVIAHLDLDSFFASIEMRDNPELKDQPVIIGRKPPARGVVSTCSYEARKYGIKSAMPVSTAQRLCPKAIFVEPRIDYYNKVSKEIFSLVERYSVFMEKTGIDEAYLDLTGLIPLFHSYEDLAKEIKEQVYKNFKLTCSIGVSCSKVISKIASDRCKPDGILIIEKDKLNDFINFLPISAFPFIGKKSSESLKKLGIIYFKDLFQFDLDFLINKVGSFISYYYLKQFLHETSFQQNATQKSYSTETTFDEDCKFSDELFNLISQMASELALRLREDNYKASVITSKIRDEDFETYQKQITLSEPTFDDNVIANIAFENMENLLKSKVKGEKVRLIGIKLSGLVKDNSNLFDTNVKKDIAIKKVDELNKKFGKNIVQKGFVWRKKV